MWQFKLECWIWSKVIFIQCLHKSWSFGKMEIAFQSVGMLLEQTNERNRFIYCMGHAVQWRIIWLALPWTFRSPKLKRCNLWHTSACLASTQTLKPIWKSKTKKKRTHTRTHSVNKVLFKHNDLSSALSLFDVNVIALSLTVPAISHSIKNAIAQQ